MIKLKADELFCEFYSTMMIVLFSNIAGLRLQKDPFGYAIVVLLVYTFFSWAGLRFSGAHFNPAVTFSYIIQKEVSLVKGLIIIGVQTAASFSAAVVINLLSSGFKIDSNLII
jgi:aquaporin-0